MEDPGIREAGHLGEAASERVVLDILRRYSAYVHLHDVPTDAAAVREFRPNRFSTKRLDSLV